MTSEVLEKQQRLSNKKYNTVFIYHKYRHRQQVLVDLIPSNLRQISCGCYKRQGTGLYSQVTAAQFLQKDT